jgi:hypothetical protein
MASNLTKFDLAEMLRCGKAIRRAMAGEGTMEAAAHAACHALYDELRSDDGKTPACALVRCYKTHRFGDLDPALQSFARNTLAEPPRDAMQCLVLLATVGALPEWNDRRRSKGHQAIPLPSKEIVERAPMIAQMFTELGISIEHVVSPSRDVVSNFAGKTYGVFHVEDAVGSPFIPAQQEFVIRHGIESVVGFGGGLTNGDVFAVVLFCRVSVSASTADRFRALALEVKTGFFHYSDSQVFDRPAIRPK